MRIVELTSRTLDYGVRSLSKSGEFVCSEAKAPPFYFCLDLRFNSAVATFKLPKTPQSPFHCSRPEPAQCSGSSRPCPRKRPPNNNYLLFLCAHCFQRRLMLTSSFHSTGAGGYADTLDAAAVCGDAVVDKDRAAQRQRLCQDRDIAGHDRGWETKF